MKWLCMIIYGIPLRRIDTENKNKSWQHIKN